MAVETRLPSGGWGSRRRYTLGIFPSEQWAGFVANLAAKTWTNENRQCFWTLAVSMKWWKAQLLWWDAREQWGVSRGAKWTTIGIFPSEALAEWCARVAYQGGRAAGWMQPGRVPQLVTWGIHPYP